MANTDFVAKNGLQVNGGTWVVNATGIYYGGAAVANSTFFFQAANTALNANNATYLGGATASAYVNTSGNFTMSGNINFTGANTNFASGWKIGANVVANTQSLFFGNASVNAVINSTGLYVNGTLFESGTDGGYYKGNDGTIGNTVSKGNLYRLNSNTQSNNITIEAGENALTVGPIVINDGYNLTIAEGGRAVII